MHMYKITNICLCELSVLPNDRFRISFLLFHTVPLVIIISIRIVHGVLFTPHCHVKLSGMLQFSLYIGAGLHGNLS